MWKTIMDPLFLHSLVNRLYKKNFDLYKAIYFTYKNISEREECKMINRYVHKGDKVLDIGANIGFYTLMFSKLVGKRGRVYAFEPEKKNYMNLKRILRGRKNVILNNTAVNDSSGKIKLYLSDKLNVDHRTFETGEKRQSLLVKGVSIDDYLKTDENMNIVKIDTQGYEYQVLLGMKRTILRSKHVTIFCEVDPEGLKKSGASEQKLFSLLKQWGFKMKRLGKGAAKSAGYYDIVAVKS